MFKFSVRLMIITVLYTASFAQFIEMSVNTHTYHGYKAPNNVAAFWISDSIFNFIRTISINGGLDPETGARKNLANLSYVSGMDSTDAITGATHRGHGNRTAVWDCTDTLGTLLENGKYFMHFEMNETHSFTHASFPGPYKAYKIYINGAKDTLFEFADYSHTDAWLESLYQGVSQKVYSEVNIAYYAPGPGKLRFGSVQYVHREGVGAAVITVERVHGRTGEVSVDYATADSSATDGSDYTSVANTVTFADNEYGSKTFTVDITDDGSEEDVEYLKLTLGNPAGGAEIGDIGQAVLAVVDDDGAISDDGLVGYWGFDLGAGQTVYDASGSGNHGTLNYTVRQASGAGSSAGFEAYDAYIETTKDPSLSITGPVTVSLWMNPNTRQDTIQHVVQAMDQYILTIEADNAVQFSDGKGAFVKTSTDALNFGSWNHIAAVFSGVQDDALTADNAKIYINGASAGNSVSGTWSPGPEPYGPVTFGTNYFSGLLDEVYIYNRALSEPEITALYSESQSTAVRTTGQKINRNQLVLRAGPNPFNSRITLEIPAIKQPASIRIYDVHGREVARMDNIKASSIVWKPEQMADGVYLIKLQAGESQACQKVYLIR